MERTVAQRLFETRCQETQSKFGELVRRITLSHRRVENWCRLPTADTSSNAGLSLCCRRRYRPRAVIIPNHFFADLSHSSFELSSDLFLQI